MNGIHDVGGMDGFGPVDTDADETGFHERWEGEAYALFVATLGNGVANLDEFRYAIERMAPADYLGSSYYERWLTAFETLLVENDVLERDELASRIDAFESGNAELPEYEDSEKLAELQTGLKDAYAARTHPQEPSFDGGDRVIVRNEHPTGHTRCPRYARGATGTIEAHRGTFMLPDASAHGEDASEPVYNVRFDAQELWGSDRAGGSAVRLELWESYLEPASVGGGA